MQVECPQCQQSVTLPDKMAGSAVSCPRCEHRFIAGRVSGGRSAPLAVPPPLATAPGSAAAKPEASAVSARASAPSAPPKSGNSRAATPKPPLGPENRTTAAPASSQPPVPAPPAKPQRKSARFIPTETASSLLPVAEGEKLPELHLAEDAAAARPQRQRSGVNPLVLFGLLSMSMVLSLVLAFIDLEPPGTNMEQIARARRVVEEEYFSDLGGPEPTAAYQILLRQAHQAWARGDYRAERQYYREVLELLRAERGEFDGITGSLARDRRLEEQLVILLSSD